MFETYGCRSSVVSTQTGSRTGRSGVEPRRTKSLISSKTPRPVLYLPSLQCRGKRMIFP